MMNKKPSRAASAKKRKLSEAVEILSALQFGPRQTNEIAAYSLLALLDLRPEQAWSEAGNPLRGITPIIEFIAEAYGVRYAPNTRETIRDDAVKFFVEAGLLLRNPDDPGRATNSMRTVYQIESTALALLRGYGTRTWNSTLSDYLTSRAELQARLRQHRKLARVPVTLPDGRRVSLSPGGQNPLIKAIVEQFCERFAQGGVVVYLGDTENKLANLDGAYLAKLGVTLDTAAKIPDVIVYVPKKNWLLLIEAVTSAGPVDGKRRNELRELFRSCTAGLVFVTTFASRKAMQMYVSQIAWESEVWVADDPDHLIHFDGERFLGPYPDAMPRT